jgi:hypothetical protein
MDLETHKARYVDIETQKTVHKKELVRLNKERREHYDFLIETMEHDAMSVMDCGEGLTIVRKSKVPNPSSKDLIQLLTSEQVDEVKARPRSPKVSFVSGPPRKQDKKRKRNLEEEEGEDQEQE